MNKEKILEEIKEAKNDGKIIVAFLCNHVPMEILAHEKIRAFKISHFEDSGDIYPGELPNNLCPVVRESFSILNSSFADSIDMIIAESSCDGKKKMFEILDNQEKLYYFQIPQGMERNYSKKLLKSEADYLLKEIEKRFELKINEQDIKKNIILVNRHRNSVNNLMELLKRDKKLSSGMEIYDILSGSENFLGLEKRISFLEEKYKEINEREQGSQNNGKPRIIMTGCPLSGIYKKMISAVEKNGGTVVCFDNCEVTGHYLKHFDADGENILDSLSDCYIKSTCAVMESNDLRMATIEQLADEFNADGLIDINLITCHPFSCEKEKMKRKAKELGIPYFSVESDYSGSVSGQTETRTAAFLEML